MFNYESTQMFQLEDVCLSLLWFFILSTFSSRLSPYVWTDIKSVCVFVCVLTYIKSRCGEKNMCGLGDICSMEAVVVRYVSMVMVLQGHHVSDKGVDWDTKCLQQLSLLRRSETKEKGSTPCTWAQTRTVHIYTIIFFTWKMAYMMQLRGLLLENSATLNMLKLHLSRSSSSCFNTQSKASHSLKITLFQKCFIKTFRWSY